MSSLGGMDLSLPSILLIGYLALYSFIILVFLFLLCSRRNYQPLKFRAPILVFICAVACNVLVAWIAVFLLCQTLYPNNASDCTSLLCGDAEWIVWMAYTSFFVPYVLRCYRIIKIFSVDDDALVINSKYWDSMVMRESWLVKLFFVALFISALVKYSLELGGIQWHALGCSNDDDPGLHTNIYHYTYIHTYRVARKGDVR